MSLHIKYTASSLGNRNIFDNDLNFATYGGVGDGVTSNNTALTSFNTAYAALSGRTRVTVNPGTYVFASQMSWGALGGDRLTIAAPGVTFQCPSTVNGFVVASGGPANTNTGHANLVTVSAGATTVTLITAGQTSRFTTGQWALITNGDMQGGGYPQNPWTFEFKKIASIGTGTLTFTEPLLYSYSSTIPNYNAGSGSSLYQGGPATAYALIPAWNQEIEMQGATFTDTANGFYGKCRVAKWTDCTFATFGPFPTMCDVYQMLRCTGAGFGGLEVDKCINSMSFIDSAPRAVDLQSASINHLYVSNVASSSRWRGGGKSNYFSGLTTPDFEFGIMNYGAMGPTYMENCVSSGATWFSANVYPFSDYTEEGSGVLSYSGGPSPTSRTGYWAVPGTTCVLLDGSNAFAQTFQVLDVTATGGRTYVTTTLPNPVPSTINGKSSPWRIACHPCADATLVNCSGSALFTSQSLLPAHSPLFGWA